MKTKSNAPANRVRLKRFHERGRYDAGTIKTILDAGLICHVAFQHEGEAAVIPTLYWHDEERLYLHGSTASRMIRAIEGQRICIAITLLDGLVLTRSAFHHSANYRSVTIYGKAHAVDQAEEKKRQLERMMERMFTGRWKELRPIRPQELKATRIMSIPLSEASAKIRTGPPDEDEADWTWPVWAGVIPVQTSILPGISDGRNGGDAIEPMLAVRGLSSAS